LYAGRYRVYINGKEILQSRILVSEFFLRDTEKARKNPRKTPKKRNTLKVRKAKPSRNNRKNNRKKTGKTPGKKTQQTWRKKRKKTHLFWLSLLLFQGLLNQCLICFLERFFVEVRPRHEDGGYYPNNFFHRQSEFGIMFLDSVSGERRGRGRGEEGEGERERERGRGEMEME
jgi:hypothetical protein